MAEELNNIVELIDENEQLVRFEHIMTIEYGDNDYVILSPIEHANHEDEDEVIILRIDQNEDGEDIYISIDDQDELEEIFDAFQQIMDAQQDDMPDEE
ncbi:MAG: DUF1292 domain-containing protein [Clostridia bacterium]|jgi:uncharacterized protein YrzB (UPF0473 family)